MYGGAMEIGTVSLPPHPCWYCGVPVVYVLGVSSERSWSEGLGFDHSTHPIEWPVCTFDQYIATVSSGTVASKVRTTHGSSRDQERRGHGDSHKPTLKPTNSYPTNITM